MKFSPTQATATRQPHLGNVFLRALQTGCALPLLALGCLLSGTMLDAQSPAPAPAVAPEPAPPADNRPQTVISSDELDMVGGDEANHFYFRGNVKVQATNMIATCDELEVISARQQSKGESDAAQQGQSAAAAAQQSKNDATVAQQGQSDATSAPQQGESPDSRAKREAAAPNIGSIREIIMRGNVVISQEGRRATAGVAYLYPQEGRVVLAENPLVTDAQGTLSGWRMELYRGERKVRILSNPEETQRTRVTLPALQDLGYGVPEEPASTKENATADKAESTQGQASETTGAPAATEPSTPATEPSASSQSTGQTAATSTAAPATSTSQATTDKAESKAEEKAEPAPSRRSSGWNPVNRR